MGLLFYMALAGVLALAGFFFLRFLFRYMIDRRISTYQSELVEKHCEEVENMYRQVRGWRHDYKHHIQTMKAHLAMKQYDVLENYLNDLDVDLTTVDTVVKTGNVRIDAVLNSKLAVAKKKQIPVNAKAIVPKELPVSEVDLCIILGNLLDNAMEACEKQPAEDSRFIRVYIGILKSQLYIYVANSMTNDIKKQGKTYLTTKTGGHGFGLLRVDRVVARYGGYLNRQHETGVFATGITTCAQGTSFCALFLCQGKYMLYCGIEERRDKFEDRRKNIFCVPKYFISY